MRMVFSAEIEKGRDRIDSEYATKPGETYGRFRLRCPLTGQLLIMLVGDGEQWAELGMPGNPWQHVSVSTPTRCPTWREMCWVKDQFFDPEEWVVQFHPAKSDYVNDHEYTLHLWRPLGIQFPIPPKECV